MEILIFMAKLKKKKTIKQKKKKPAYSQKACVMIDNICECERAKAKAVKPGRGFSKYIKDICK